MTTSHNRGVLRRYLDAINRHQTAEALSCLRDDFVLEFPGGPKLDKHGIESALGWDAGTEGRVEWTVTEEEASEITIEGAETNEFLRLLGIEPLSFRSRFSFGDDGLIAHQSHEVDWSGAAVDEALEPVVAWATESAPDELAELYADGRIAYTREAGRGWVALLRRWTDERAE